MRLLSSFTSNSSCNVIQPKKIVTLYIFWMKTLAYQITNNVQYISVVMYMYKPMISYPSLEVSSNKINKDEKSFIFELSLQKDDNLAN